MGGSKRKHPDMDARKAIEDGIGDKLTAREIARRIDVSQTTVTREVKANRTVKVPKRKHIGARARCARFHECRHARTVCRACSAPPKTRSCRRCKAVRCFDFRLDFELRMCEKTEKRPYVCTCCTYDRDGCELPKCRYSATEAHRASLSRRSAPGKGVSVTEAELERMVGTVRPLVRKGQSLEAVWATHGDGFPVGARAFYNYIESGAVDIASLELPRKVRYKKRKRRAEPARDRIDRTGRLYEGFPALAEEERLSAVQMDAVLGFQGNRSRILGLRFRRLIFQLYLLLRGPEASNVVAALDAVEASLGSRDAFERTLGVLLADRRGGMNGTKITAGTWERDMLYGTSQIQHYRKIRIGIRTSPSCGSSVKRLLRLPSLESEWALVIGRRCTPWTRPATSLHSIRRRTSTG